MQTGELASRIASLYAGLKGVNSYSPAIIAKTINSILLNEGVTSKELGEAWDEWFSAHRDRKNDH
jgi:hypothetical protein